MGDYDEDDKKSKFNAGLAKLERIGELRKGIHDARIDNHLEKWKACLEGIRSEINSKLTIDQKQECNDMEARMQIAFAQYYKAKRINKPSSVNPREALYRYELYIGDLEEKTGMGMPEEEDDGL